MVGVKGGMVFYRSDRVRELDIKREVCGVGFVVERMEVFFFIG